MNDNKVHAAWGWLCIAIGAAILLSVFGAIDPQGKQSDASPWVLSLCGVVFSVGGFMVLAGPTSKLTSLGAAIVCTCFGVLGVWAVFFSPPESLSGGIPFLSQSVNAVLGKWMFAIGSIISFTIVVYAFREYRNRDH